MRFAQIRKFDVSNGPGIRTSIFVTGCTHRCFNCFNEEYQDFEFGEVWTDIQTEKLLEYLNDENVSGLTVLGGEPFQNVDGLVPILEKVREGTEKSVWVYTGYNFEELIEDSGKKRMLELIDVLIDGRYVDKLKDLKLKFRGSSNQRIIDVKSSIEKGRVILEME